MALEMWDLRLRNPLFRTLITSGTIRMSMDGQKGQGSILLGGTDPKTVLPTAQSIIVLLEVYAGLRDSISPLSFVTISRGIIPTVIFRTRRF